MPDMSVEQRLGGRVAGIDEAGRGPWAGPVVAAAVVFDPAPDRLPAGLADALDDSKKLTPARRQALFASLTDPGHGIAYGIGAASVAEIDRLNILRATFLAMARAVAALEARSGPIDHALVDGNRPPPLGRPVTTLVGGDGLSLSVAAASILAKVTRDRLMIALGARHPDFGFARNMGYGTAVHRAALARLGPTAHHRRSYAPVASRLRQLELALPPATPCAGE